MLTVQFAPDTELERDAFWGPGGWVEGSRPNRMNNLTTYNRLCKLRMEVRKGPWIAKYGIARCLRLRHNVYMFTKLLQ